MNRIRIVIWLGLVGLAACDQPNYTESVVAAPLIPAEPILEAPVITPDTECSTEDIGGGDGIGGTGCPVD